MTFVRSTFSVGLTLFLFLIFSSLAFGQRLPLRVTSPTPAQDGTIVTSEPAIYLKGTFAATGADKRLLWESNRGFSDLIMARTAEGGRTFTWSTAAPVPLRPGLNHVRIHSLGQSAASTFVNIWYAPRRPDPPTEFRTGTLDGRQVRYEVRDGLAIYQNDIILGTAEKVEAATQRDPPSQNSLRRVGGAIPQAVTIGPNSSSATGLWPVVNGVARIPYTITQQTTANTANINAAIAESNTQLAGVLQWEPATASDTNLVNFDFDPNNTSGSCEAFVGMIGNTQVIGGAINCTINTILHEMGHTVGLFHEQSRSDRDAYVNFMEQNIDKPNHGNFDVNPGSVNSGLYNYASIMEYSSFIFNKDGASPTLETLPAGMVLGSTMPQYTTGDLDGIMRLYAHAPSSITVDTNPTGLQVIVDGTKCTAPCVFTTWTAGSQHTLNVPLDANNQTLQTLSGQNYIFGRWNASPSAGTVPSNGGCPSNGCSVTVTNSFGNGTLLSPSTAPAVTNYLASFIPIHPFTPVVSPAGNGTILPLPVPSTLIINGTPTNYYQDRQLVTVTVTPNSGFNFLFWANVPLFNIYNDPYTFYITSNFDSSFNGNPTTATLVSDAVTTIAAASPDLTSVGIVPGFAIGVTDGKGNQSNAFTPVNFDGQFNGAGFASGQTLTFSSAATELPVTTNISYAFNNFTGMGTPNGNTTTVVVPASGHSQTTANYTPSFRANIAPAIGTSTFCNDGTGHNELSIAANPPGINETGTFGNIDAFFPAGTVNFTASPGASGLNFVGWTEDMASGGTANPLAFPLAGQVLGTANFNLSGITAPLTITGITPVPTATIGPATLTVNGTGFSTSSSTLFIYYVDTTGLFHFRSNTPGTSTQVTVPLCGAGGGCPGGESSTWPGDIPSAGYYRIAVLNAETTTNCNPSAVATFAVANSAGPPVLGITKSHVGNFSTGQQNAQYTLSVSNNGTGPTIDPVTVTEMVPSGETLVSMSGSGWTCTAGSNTCTRSDALAAGMSYAAITVTVNVAANSTSPQVNTATVTGGGCASATATDTTTIVAATSSPTIAKSFNPATIQSGASSTVTLTLANGNAAALTGGAFTDTLANMSASGGAVGGTCTGTTPGSLTAGATALSFSGITIPASGNCTVTFNVTSTTPGAQPNTASGVTTTQTPAAGAASNTATLTVLSAPIIAKAFSPTLIQSGAASTVTLTLTNGNATALTGGAFTDTLAHMSASGGAVGGTCVGTTPASLTAGATALSFSGITIPASGNCTVTFSATSTTPGAQPNTTSGVTTAQTPTAGAASNTATLSVLAAPTIAKAFNPTSIPSGATSTVTLTLTNANATALTGGAFTDTLAHMSASGGAVGGTCVGTAPASLTAGATALSFTGITIPASGNCTVTFSVTSATVGSQPNTTSGVKTTQTPTTGAASNTASLTVTGLAAPTIAKAFNPASISSGSTSMVTLTLTNTNSTALTGGAFTDTLAHMSASGGAVGGTCTGTTPASLTAGATALSFTGISIPANGNCTVTFSVTSTTAGAQPNTTSGVKTTQTPTAGAASNTALLTVTALAAPTIAKAFNPATIQSGGTSTVTLTLANTNATALTGGAFTDTLVKMSASGGAVGGTCTGTTPASLTAGATALSFTTITIPASSSCTVTFNITSATAGVQSNTTSGVKTTQTPTAGAASNKATLTVLAAPSITKAFSPTAIAPGGKSTVTLTLKNANTSSLTGAAFTDTLTNMSASGGAVGGTCVGTTPNTLTAGATALSFSGITIPTSGCTVTFSVASSTVGSQPNTTSGVTTTQTPTAGAASNAAILNVGAPSITKAFNPTSIPAGGASTVTLTLKNTNTTALTGAAFTDTLSKMSAVGGAIGGTCVGTTPSSLTAGAIALSFSAITIPASGSCTVTFSVTSSTVGSLPNVTSGVITAQTPTAGTVSNTATLDVGAPTIAKVFSPATIQSGGTSTVTLTLTNANATAMTGGAFTDSLVHMSASGGSVGGTCTGTTPSSLTAGATALSFSGITIPASGNCTVTFSVTSATAGAQHNTTSGVKTTQTPTAGTASNTATVTVLAAPTIAKAFSPISIASGGQSTVTLTLKNTNATALTGGAFTDALSNMNASGGAVGGTCAGITPNTLTAGATALSFTGITIPASGTCTVTFSVTSTTAGAQPNTTSGVTTTQTPTAGASSNTVTLTVQ